MITELTVETVVNAGREAWLPRRPLPSVTFAIDWWRGDGSPRAFQWTNLAIHAVTAIAVFGLLYLVLSQLEWSRRFVGVAAFAGAAIWSCHPIQIQSVTYVVQRMTSLAALFTVLTVIFYIFGRVSRSRQKWLFFAVAGLCWGLGLVSKETAAIAPFLVLLAEYGVIRHNRLLIRQRADIAVLSIPAIVVVLVAADLITGVGPVSRVFLSGYEIRDFTMAERLLTQPRVIGFHLSQFIWPLPGRFSLEHDFTLSTGVASPVSTLFAMLALGAWISLGTWSLFRPRLRTVGFFLLWFPASLVIESSFIPLEMIFEHRMYLPSVALAGLVALIIGLTLQRMPRSMPVMIAGSTAAIIFLVVSSAQRVPEWRTQVMLNQSTVKNAPNSARAWGQLAAALRQEGHGWEKVAPPMMRALALDAGQSTALNLRALQFIEQRRLDEADAILRSIAPRAKIDHSIWNTIGLLRFEQGNFPAAIEQFEKVVALDSFVPEFKYNLALSYEYAGRCGEAYATWRSLLASSDNEFLNTSVSKRLITNFATQGGRCFGRY
jgi:Flp pilus assembly protein TadD